MSYFAVKRTGRAATAIQQPCPIISAYVPAIQIRYAATLVLVYATAVPVCYAVDMLCYRPVLPRSRYRIGQQRRPIA
eukprot:228605-Rhodomonas_salina.1